MVFRDSFSLGQKRFLLSELIGKAVKIAWASDRGLQGVQGIILDETANTFLLGTGKGRKLVPKKACKFFFPQAPGELVVEGKLLACKPEERTKKLARIL